MVNCPKCQTPNADGVKFCKSCRTPLPKSAESRCCPNGHIMDALWTVCPVCKAPVNSPNVAGGDRKSPAEAAMANRETVPDYGEQAVYVGSSANSPARRKTVPEYNQPPQAAGRPDPERPMEPSAPPVSPDPRPGPSKRGRTIVASIDSDKPQAASAQKNKLVGFLVSYALDPAGSYFELREGRYVIGRDNSADISIPGDNL
ncbi:MAG: zinc ribbon domain-containing protein, partial [Deltaproteobacteria bacterium]|nr:zinc ribbon domain-containing protein [Deltaproteobacteria bacterium]